MSSKKVEIMYFAILREQSNKGLEIIETEAYTAEELFKELTQEYNFTLHPHQVRVSINEGFQDMNSTINDGDQIVFIPPVAGG